MATAGLLPLVLLAALFALAAVRSSAHPGRASTAVAVTPVVSRAALERYAVRLAKAWEGETEADGVVRDPLIPAGSALRTNGSARFMIIMMADAMLRLSALEGISSLARTAERILSETVSLPATSDPFNLLGLASLIRDGQRGLLPAGAWRQIEPRVTHLADQITFPTARETECSHQVECYDNHRLVWAAGASVLLTDRLPEDGISGTLLGEPARVQARIGYDLESASVSSSTPAKASSGVTMREVSDPGEEPSAYHILSTWMLNMVRQYSPGSMTPALEVLRGEAESYALAMMAPDGQLSLAGRSLDQSWVQAAAASLGAELAQPAGGPRWSEFADRALAYLLRHYTTRAGGTLAIVPGLALDWSPSLVDGYAEYNQFNGLTLWFLVEALSDWSNVGHSSAPTGAPPTAATGDAPPDSTGAGPATSGLPADGNLLVDDLVSSGLVWGRSGHVWWMISGRTTAPDRRSEQGLVDVKVLSRGRWRDLLALRPIEGLSSAWKLTYGGGQVSPVFSTATGGAGRLALHGFFRLPGRLSIPVTWGLRVTAAGLRTAMWVGSVQQDGAEAAAAHPGARQTAAGAAARVLAGTAGKRRRHRRRPAAGPHYILTATIWTPTRRAKIASDAARVYHEHCVVSASGRACPVVLRWRLGSRHERAELALGA
jgi:hypothetical protein